MLTLLALGCFGVSRHAKNWDKVRTLWELNVKTTGAVIPPELERNLAA